MNRTTWLQDRRMQKFRDVLSRRERKELSAMEAGELLGCSERQFRRYRQRYDEDGLEGLVDKRLGRASEKRVPVDEIAWMLDQYRRHHPGWTVKHFHEHLQERHSFRWGYTWTKTQLHAAGLVARAKRRGAHRRKRPRKPCIGMMLHQDGSRFAWLAGQADLDLIVTMDDATSEIYSAFLVEEEGTASSFRGLADVFTTRGLPASLYTDRGSHYFFTRRPARRSTRTGSPSSGGRSSSLGSSTFRPTRHRRVGARSACSARCRIACPRSSNWPPSAILAPPTSSSARCTSRRTMRASPGLRPCPRARSCR
jgi:transposase